jgi:hypothetical protein
MTKRIGTVLVRTDANGKMASVSMRDSTGNPKADARYMQYARTIFPALMPDAKPNKGYTYQVFGDSTATSGDIMVSQPRRN